MGEFIFTCQDGDDIFHMQVRWVGELKIKFVGDARDINCELVEAAWIPGEGFNLKSDFLIDEFLKFLMVTGDLQAVINDPG